MIRNTSSSPVIFRIYASLSKKFVIPQKYGVLESNESTNISVKLKKFVSVDSADDCIAKISVEFVYYDEIYFTMDPVLFWREQGDAYLRKVVLCRAIKWEQREAIESRKRSLSMSEVMIEYDGFDQPYSDMKANDLMQHKESYSIGQSTALVETKPTKQIETVSRKLSLGAATPDESPEIKLRRQSMNMTLSELSTSFDDGISLKKADTDQPLSGAPSEKEDEQGEFKNVIDEMKYFMKQASKLELVAESETDIPESVDNDECNVEQASGANAVHENTSESSLPSNYGPTPVKQDVDVELENRKSNSEVPEKTFSEQISDANVGPKDTAQSDEGGKSSKVMTTNPTQRRVSWIRAPDLLRISPLTLSFQGFYVWDVTLKTNYFPLFIVFIYLLYRLFRNEICD